MSATSGHKHSRALIWALVALNTQSQSALLSSQFSPNTARAERSSAAPKRSRALCLSTQNARVKNFIGFGHERSLLAIFGLTANVFMNAREGTPNFVECSSSPAVSVHKRLSAREAIGSYYFTWPHKNSFLAIITVAPQGCIFTLCHCRILPYLRLR